MAARNLPNLGLRAFYNPGDNGWGAEMSQNMLKLSVLVQAGAAGLVGVLPGAPANGAVYILDEDAGANANNIAVRDDGAWVFIEPSEGWFVYDRDQNKYLTFNGNRWLAFAGGGGGGGGSLPPGGSTGQVLGKLSDTDGDADWIDQTGDGGDGGPVIPPEYHAYWRLFSTVNNGDPWTGLNELQFLDPEENQVATSGGNIVFSADDGGSFGGAATAFDGTTNGSTHWQDHATTGAWIGYHFPDPVAVQGVKVWGCYIPAQTPQVFQIQYSDDGASWTQLYEVSAGAGGWAAGEVRKFMNPDFVNTTGQHQFWALFDVQAKVGGYAQCQAIHWSLNGDAPVYPVSYSALGFYNNDGGYDPNNLLDDTGAAWAAESDKPHWLIADFGVPKKFDKIEILPVPGGEVQGFRMMTVGYSDDGIMFTMVGSYPIGAAWVNGVYKTFDIPN